MNRRRFISSFSGAALIAGCSRGAMTLNSRDLVNTSEKRAEYLSRLLDEICIKLGPRPCGSPNFLASTEIMLREFSKATSSAMLDEYSFERWIPVGETEFYIGGNRIESYHGHGTAGTPPNGLTGIVKPCAEEKLPWCIVEPASGEIIAYITGGYDLAVPLPYYMHKKPLNSPPAFNIGKVDMPLIEKAASDGTPVHVKSEAHFEPDTKTANVVATIPGKSKEEILFIAHLDTVYNTVGANDNTASAIMLVMLAHAFSGDVPPKTLTFVACDGEEYDKLGAVNYAERRKREGTFGNIRYLVNFDSLTWGENMLIQTTDSGLRDMIPAIDSTLDLPGTPILTDGDGFALDGRPFRDDAIRAMYVNSRGGPNLGVWHRPSDTPDSVDPAYAEIGFRMFEEYIRRLMSV